MSKHFLPVKNFLHTCDDQSWYALCLSGDFAPIPCHLCIFNLPTPVAPSPQVFTIPKSADFSSGPLNAILSLGFSFLEAQLHRLFSHGIYKPHLLAIGLLS